MIVAIQSMGVPRLYYARETCYHKSNGGFAADAEKAARRREKNEGGCVDLRMLENAANQKPSPQGEAFW